MGFDIAGGTGRVGPVKKLPRTAAVTAMRDLPARIHTVWIGVSQLAGHLSGGRFPLFVAHSMRFSPTSFHGG